MKSGDKTSLSHGLWPCGNLQTAAITASVAEVVAIVLVTANYLEETLSTELFNIHLVALSLVSFFLLFSNLLMLYGTVKQMNSLLLPWLVLHLAAILGTLIFCSIKFKTLVGYRTLLIIGILIQAYFFALVFLYYQELKAANGIATSQDLTTPPCEGKKPNECLIDLELEEKADETFSQLALRNHHSSKLYYDFAKKINNFYSSSLQTKPNQQIRRPFYPLLMKSLFLTMLKKQILPRLFRGEP